MTIREDLDALLDEMEPEYARAATSVDETRAVATAALRSAYLLADALDALPFGSTDPDTDDLDQEVAALRMEVADLRLRLELITNSGRRRRRQ
jgi:hypothetical protein